MRLAFLDLPPEERLLYFEQAAARRGVSPVVIEKDFWVCWTLALLYQSSVGDAMVFKGGTSLSKVFGLINRFSEDIDVSMSPEFLGLAGANELSRTQADRWMKHGEARCAEVVRDLVTPALKQTTLSVLGPTGQTWFEFTNDEATGSPVVLFRYPTAHTTGFDYIRRSVKVEFGSLTDQQPTGRHRVTPWIADSIPGAFNDWRCEVIALDVQRTFWEKATILHAEHYRPTNRPTPDRYSRHYADTVELAGDPHTSAALAMGDLRDRVVDWKRRFFGSSWARYDLARPRTFKVQPAADRVSALRRDYDAMRDMYFGPPRPFDEILAKLADLEARIQLMALNPIVFTEKVVRSFLRYQLTAYALADEGLHAQMRRLLSLDETRHSPLMRGPLRQLLVPSVKVPGLLN